MNETDLATGPDSLEQRVRRALATLVRTGPSGFWGVEARALFELPAVLNRVIDVSDAEAPHVVREVVEAGIERVPSHDYRDLLTVVLGFDPAADGVSARQRRQLAGRQFRKGGRPVAEGTVRQYHEPRALDLLAEALVSLEADGTASKMARRAVPRPLAPGQRYSAQDHVAGAGDDEIARSSLTCFVIGPIGSRLGPIGSPERATYEEALRVMDEVIEPACSFHGLAPVRADSLARAGEITGQIFRRLHDDDIVIADLTDANANVMYELGLRHTRDKLTVQIGEFGRLPFDISTIRTIQFSRSPMGLINARDELTRVLETGIGGDYDPVSATQVWNDAGPTPRGADGPEVVVGHDAASERDSDTDAEQGFVDIMAHAEEQIDALPAALETVAEIVGELGALAERSTANMTRSDEAGKGMRGRLQVITSYAGDLDGLAARLGSAVETYTSKLEAVSAGTLELIRRMETDSAALAEGQEFGAATRGAAAATRGAMLGFGDLVISIMENASASRVLRKPSRKLTSALDRFVDATSVVDEWDRRLQVLGIETPSHDGTGDEAGMDRNPPESAM
jgi:hypothetical protein